MPSGVAIRFNDGEGPADFSAGSDFSHPDAVAPTNPCGLSQMYAQRFGSLPIGHQTGGLAEPSSDGENRIPVPSTRPLDRILSRRHLAAAFATYGAKDRLNSMRRRADVKIL